MQKDAAGMTNDDADDRPTEVAARIDAVKYSYAKTKTGDSIYERVAV